MKLKKYIDDLNLKSWALANKNDMESYNLAKEARDLSFDNNYIKGLGESYLNLGWCYLSQSKYMVANGVFKKAKELFYNLNDKVSVTKAITGISATYYYMGNYAYCIDSNIENVLLSEKIGDKKRIFAALANSSAVFIKLLKGNKAMEFAEKALGLASDIELNHEQKVTLYKNLGDSYLVLNNLEKALYYVSKSYDIASNHEFYECKYECLTSLGKIYHKKGELDRAEKCFNEVYVLCQNKPNSEEHILDIANFYYSISDYIKAKIYVEETIHLSIKNNNDNTLLSAFKLMISIESVTGESIKSELLDVPEYFERADLSREKEKKYLEEKFGIIC